MRILPGAVIDANVLVQAPVRDTLLRLAEEPALYRPPWSTDIIAKVSRTLYGQFGIPPNRVARLESKLREHFPDAWIEDFESLIPRMINDDKDRSRIGRRRTCKSERDRYLQPPSLSTEVDAASDPSSVVRVLQVQAADIKRTFAQLRVLHKAVPAFVEVVCRDTQIKI